MKNLSNKNVLHIRKGNVEYLQFRKLLEYDDIITHAYSLGTDISYRTSKLNKEKLSDDEFDKVIQNYKNMCEALGEDYINIVKTSQEHTDNIKVVDKKINKDFMDVNLKEYGNTDALVTNKTNFILTSTNADCILLLLFDPKTKTIANIHSRMERNFAKNISKNSKKNERKISM